MVTYFLTSSKRSLKKTFNSNKKYKLATYRFELIKLITSFYTDLKIALIAPLYFHFGHYSWFINYVVTYGELAETALIYLIAIMCIRWAVMHRDYIFQVLIKNFYKNYIVTFNTLPLNVYFKMVFNDLISFASLSIKKSINYLQKKINK